MIWQAAIIFNTLALPASANTDVCSQSLTGSGWRPPEVVSHSEELEFDALTARLTQYRAIIVGESHDRYDHHLNQLEIICRLYQRHPDLAIGLEFFQQPYQEFLDDYIEGRIGAREMLAKTEYYDRWRFDFRLYAPIFEYARDKRIPLIALNVPREISEKVARQGLSGLTAEERAQVPSELDRDVPGYEARLRAVFEQHPEIRQMGFDNFVSAQLVWDESMAERAARYLEAHPGRRLVVLAGVGHVIRSGIPVRFSRRTGVESAVVLQGEAGEFSAGAGDFLLASEAIEAPRGGLLGVILDSREGGVFVTGFSEDSAGKEAGILKQDQIVALDGTPVDTYSDLRLALMDKDPGDPVSVTVERTSTGLMTRESTYRVTLR